LHVIELSAIPTLDIGLNKVSQKHNIRPIDAEIILIFTHKSLPSNLILRYGGCWQLHQ